MTQQDDEVSARLFDKPLSRRAVLGRAVAGGVGVAVLSTARFGASRVDAASVGGASVAANPWNVLSAAVTVDTSAAQQVRVEYAAAGGGVAAATPDFPVTGASTVVPVLGLWPDTDYTMQAVVTGADGVRPVGDALPFRTGSMPASIPQVTVKQHGRSEPGYTLLTVTSLPPAHFLEPSMVLIVDETGRVVWYRQTATSPLDFQMQPNGHFTAALSQKGSLPIFGASIYEEWDLLGNVVGTWSAQGHDFTDWHDIRLLNGGEDAMLLALVGQERDTRAVGGPDKAVVIGHVLQRVNRSGKLLFEWSAFDHYKLEDATPAAWHDPNTPAGYFDWTHPNAIWVDADGHYLVSSRHFSEVTKIDGTSGAVIWRMGGGPANQFKFIDDPHNGFSLQHAVRRLENGRLLILDNGNDHKPPSSRVVEYEVDEAAKTARLVWSFEPGAFGFAMGYAERLPGGNTIANFGHDYRVFEVTPDGEVVWELELPIRGWGAPAWRHVPVALEAGSFGIYRAVRIPSLYGLSR